MKKNIFFCVALLINACVYAAQFDDDGRLIFSGFSKARLVIDPQLAKKIKEEVSNNFLKEKKSFSQDVVDIIVRNQAIYVAYNNIILSKFVKQNAINTFNDIIDQHTCYASNYRYYKRDELY